MSTAERDISNFDGQPISLYEFRRTTIPTTTGVPVTTYYRYTNADQDITFDGDVYTAITISDDGIKQTGSEVSDELRVTLPADSTIPDLFLVAPPEDPIHLTIRRTHHGETDAFLAWVGVVAQASRPDDLRAVLLGQTISSDLNRGGLRMVWQRGCPHALYDSECRADPADFTIAGTVAAVSGTTLTVTGFDSVANEWLNGGWVEKLDGEGHALRKAIVSHTTTLVEVLGVTYGFEVGDLVQGYAGCNRTPTDCADKFDNLSNYGGHPYLAGKSPFDGDPVF
jgi:uncharacterized phage protein (TIGR02218 family)